MPAAEAGVRPDEEQMNRPSLIERTFPEPKDGVNVEVNRVPTTLDGRELRHTFSRKGPLPLRPTASTGHELPAASAHRLGVHERHR